MIFVRLPKCEPMDTIIKVELGGHLTQVEELIPSHIVVPRCSGLHTWKCGFNANEKTHNNKAKKCVSSSETAQEVKVSSYNFRNIVKLVQSLFEHRPSTSESL